MGANRRPMIRNKTLRFCMIFPHVDLLKTYWGSRVSDL